MNYYFYEAQDFDNRKTFIRHYKAENEQQAVESLKQEAHRYQNHELYLVCIIPEAEYNYLRDCIMKELEDPIFRRKVTIRGIAVSVDHDFKKRFPKYKESADPSINISLIERILNSEEYADVFRYIEKCCRSDFEHPPIDPKEFF